MGRAKANKLLLSTRQAIGKYKDKYPNATIGEIAGKYNCTYNQVRKAIEDNKSGKLFREKTRAKDVSKILAENSSESLFKKQFDLSLAMLESDKDMAVDARIVLLDRLAGINKTLQQISLQNHLKRTDAGLIARIIRRYEPQVSDERIIQIYHEELELWKISL